MLDLIDRSLGWGRAEEGCGEREMQVQHRTERKGYHMFTEAKKQGRERMYLAEDEGDGCKRAGAVDEVVAVGEESGRRCAGSLSRADLESLDRWFAVRRSAMDYAIGRQAGGGSSGGQRGGIYALPHGPEGLSRSRALLGVELWLRRTDGLRAWMEGITSDHPNSGRGGWLVEMRFQW